MTAYFRNIKLIMSRELRTYFQSPVGYVIIAITLFAQGIFFYSLLTGSLFNVADHRASYITENTIRIIGTATMLIAPLISMRLLTDERTMELLYTSPVRNSEIVLGKYFASFVFYFIILLFTFHMPWFLTRIGDISGMQVFTGLFGTVLVSCTVLSIGIFASSFSRYQVISFLVSFFIIVFLAISSMFNNSIENETIKSILTNISLYVHFKDFEVGIINLKDVIYMLSITVFFLYLTTKIIESRRWK